jgi:hypothetical protein
MGHEPRNPRELKSVVTRLTGTKGKRTNETLAFSITVTSSDGETVTITHQISEKKFYRANLGALADSIRVERSRLAEVLDNWGPDELCAHLSGYPAEVLRSAATKKLFREHDAAIAADVAATSAKPATRRERPPAP